MIKLKLSHCKIILRHWHLLILLYNLPHGLKALVWYISALYTIRNIRGNHVLHNDYTAFCNYISRSDSNDISVNGVNLIFT